MSVVVVGFRPAFGDRSLRRRRARGEEERERANESSAERSVHRHLLFSGWRARGVTSPETLAKTRGAARGGALSQAARSDVHLGRRLDGLRVAPVHVEPARVRGRRGRRCSRGLRGGAGAGAGAAPAAGCPAAAAAAARAAARRWASDWPSVEAGCCGGLGYARHGLGRGGTCRWRDRNGHARWYRRARIRRDPQHQFLGFVAQVQA